MWRPLAYLWACPVTLLGLCLARMALATGGSVRVRAGVVESSGGWAGALYRGNRLWRGGAALALGQVNLARDSACLARSRTHELVHVGQYERWGPFFLPAYWLVGGWLRLTGRHPYLDHPFEPPLEHFQKPSCAFLRCMK